MEKPLHTFCFRIFVGLILVLHAVCPLRSQDAASIPPSVKIENISVGFDGYYKVGRWSPLTVTVRSAAPVTAQFVTEVLDSDGSATSNPSELIELAADVSQTVELLFKSGRLDSEIRLTILDESGSRLADRRISPNGLSPNQSAHAVRLSERLRILVGGPANGSPSQSTDEERNSNFGNRQTENGYVLNFDSWSQLPRQQLAYDGVDAVIVAGDYDIDEGRNQSLQEWVQLGGVVHVSVGSDLPAFRESQMAGWLPIKIVGSANVTELSGIENFARHSEKIRIRFGNITAARVEAEEGRVLISGVRRGDGPLLVRAPYGFGHVHLLAVDLHNPPLADWPGFDTFLERTLEDESSRSNSDIQQRKETRLSRSGVTELATQLRSIQDDFSQIRRLSIWSVLGLILLYLVIVGPLDYLLVHRVLQRPHLTWITFPSLVCVATMLSIWSASSLNGSKLLLNQLDVIDIDVGTGDVRTSSFLTIYSPETRSYEVDVEPRMEQLAEELEQEPAKPNASKRATVSWNGVPEEGVGGLYRRSGIELGNPGYRFADHASRIENLPISIWSTRQLTTSWNANVGPLIESSLTSPGAGQLNGTIRSHLPVPIEDWLLAYENRVFSPRAREGDTETPAILPNQVWDPNSPAVYQRELQGFLTRMTAKKADADPTRPFAEDILVQTEPYDAMNLDPTYFMRMLTFHEAAGGTSYTGLQNSDLEKFDLSNMLNMHRAVLFGRVNLAAVDPQINGEAIEPTRQVAFVRLLLPVVEKTVIRRALPDFGDDD